MVGVTSNTKEPSGAEVDAASRILSDANARSDAQFVSVEDPWATLVRAQEVLGARVAAVVRADGFTTSIDAPSNGLIVETSDELKADEVDAVRSSADAAAVRVTIRVSGRESLALTPFVDCGPLGNGLFCDRPMRGGQFMRADFPNGPGCTEGFQVRGNSGNNPFVLTAGHCLQAPDGDSGPWTTRRQTGFDPFEIGSRHSSIYGPYDYGIVRVAPGSFWEGPPAPAGHVFVDGKPGETTQDEFYAINDAKSPTQGQAICLSSGIQIPQVGYWTDCGTVTAGPVNRTSQNHDGSLTSLTGVWDSNACTTPGSSGGPLYKDHHAYGLTHGGFESPCLTVFQNVQQALTNSNVHLVAP
jgi:hypothetical protein